MEKWKYRTYIALLTFKNALDSTDDHILQLSDDIIEKFKIIIPSKELNNIKNEINSNTKSMAKLDDLTKKIMYNNEDIDGKYKSAWFNIYTAHNYLARCKKTLGVHWTDIEKLKIQQTTEQIFGWK